MGYKFTLKTSLLALTGSFTLAGYAQTAPNPKSFGKQLEVTTCGAVEYENYLLQKNPKKQTKDQFESWMAPKVAAKKAQRLANFAGKSTTEEVVTIPIVVHVIHSGVPVGTDENIADEQIFSQITVLNQDYRRQAGTPGFNTNEIGADVEMEFCMAQRDPNGLKTNGIDRVYATGLFSNGSWDMQEIEALKARTQWDPEKYVNIWTFKSVTLAATYQIYGYSQFPLGSGLDGLENVDPTMTTEAIYDGIILDASCMGSSDIYPGGHYDVAGRDKGRTLSHEMGHYFGLRHIWGDANNCTADDFCADTPIAKTQHQGNCPGDTADSCPSSPGFDMWQNYMDYTNDTCLNIFTQDQKDRIRTVLENSPRRSTLGTAGSCIPGIAYTNDGSLRLQNLNLECNSTQINPEITLHNNGTATVTTATITYRIDENAPATYNWTGSLATDEETIITLPTATMAPGGHVVHYAITLINGVTGETPLNDTKAEPFVIKKYSTNQVVITVKTDDNGSETTWALIDESTEVTVAQQEDLYDDNQVYTTTVDLPEDGCYIFVIADQGINGICCEGYYEVATAEGDIIVHNSEFGNYELTSFGADVTLGTNNPEALLNSITLYPNPANSMFTIAIPQNAATPDAYTIYNSLGQVVGNGKFASNQQPVDVSTYANGIYFIRINSADSAKTLQFIKN